MNCKCLSITVEGRVQGVGFRYFTQNSARKLNIKGFVKNLTNGNVYIEACGEQDMLDEFIRLVKKGPALSHVSNLDMHKIPQQSFQDFSLKV